MRLSGPRHRSRHLLALGAVLLGLSGQVVAPPAGAHERPAPFAATEREAVGSSSAGHAAVPPASVQRPRVAGTARYGRTLTAHPGRWTERPDEVRYQWFRGAHPVPGATSRAYRLRGADLSARISVQVVAVRDGVTSTPVRTWRTRPVGHRVPLRDVVTYHLETRGRVTADLERFAEQVRTTLANPRGWRLTGVGFRRVGRGGDFTLVLSEARKVQSFSATCSALWSCRVGRYVIINEQR
jgi:hypothetical protein